MSFRGARFPIICAGRSIPTPARALCKLDSAAAVETYLRERSEGEFYIAPFVDYRGARTGFNRKYRIALIDPTPPIAVHMAISPALDDPLPQCRYDGGSGAEKRSEEARASWPVSTRDFAARHATALRAIAERFDLDYIPVRLRRDARRQAFGVRERNEHGRPLDGIRRSCFPTSRPQMEKVFGAFQAMLRNRMARIEAIAVDAA